MLLTTQELGWSLRANGPQMEIWGPFVSTYRELL